ncbi:hypothetical protein OK18_00660 [Chryseobacterium gallinarum]|uniref:DUF1896 domain-containing protein n=1 Tax=Chryseobacterium gallinarum TaxID=1324352 RepID=A0A0G3LY83_CHRGL|nr:DUF1896 family protein [Chryseobacterium gallinarum]AKK71345.1 hypothetical protein OK18_00660 [Chryseobacterium gallinarum]
MNRHTQDFSYYKAKLQEHIEASFPERSGDKRFIEQRAKWAANAYEGAFRSGNAIHKCDEIADYILFENLHFSRFDSIVEVLNYEFSDVFDELDYRDFALKILAECDAVFGQYELTDDFAYKTDYDLLYTELTGFISLWLEKNGIR